MLLATSRERCISKMAIMLEFCEEYGMRVNPSKTKFMVINGSRTERQPITIDNHTVSHTEQYTYLGTIFSADGKFRTMMESHVSRVSCNVLKFYSFLKTNRSMPFHIKRKVMDACLLSSLLYGCESWLSVSFGRLNSMYTWYMSVIKAILDVRSTTMKDACLLEMGQPTLKALVLQRQYHFFKHILAIRQNLDDDPLMLVMTICEATNTPAWRHIQDGLRRGQNEPDCETETLKTRLRDSNRTKSKTYLEINPDLAVHSVYSSISPHFPENHRISFTRLRLSSHRLRVETGRWQRIPRDQRVLERRCTG